MSLSFFFRYALRESRGSLARVGFFVACLAVGVAAIVAVAGLSLGLEQGIRSQARLLLGGDLVVRSHRPFPPALAEAVASVRGAERTDVLELVTMVAAPPKGGAPGESLLVELAVVEPSYPFYGGPVLDPAEPLGRLLSADAVVVAPEVLTRLGVARGGTLFLGGQPFRIAGTIASEPNRVAGGFSIGPRVYAAKAGLARTSLEAFGSRILRRALVKLAPGSDARAVTAAAEAIRTKLGSSADLRIETFSEAQPSLRQSIRRVDRFLALSALVSLLIGGVGVAQTVRSWLAARLDSIAILECLGLRPRDVFRLYLGQVILLGLAGSVVGSAVGTAALAFIPRLAGDLLPVGWINAWQPVAVGRGLAVGTVVGILFALPPLLVALRVSPSRVLRRDVEPLPSSPLLRIGAAVTLVAGVAGVSMLQARGARLGLEFTGGLLAAVGVLATAAVATTWAIGRLPREGVRFWFRHGLAALARPGAGTLGSIVALGLGVLVVLGHYLVHDRLDRQLAAELPTGAPTIFLLDVQPDQWLGVRAILETEKATRIDSVPVVMARLRTIDGKKVEELVEERAAAKGSGERNDRWALTREQRITYLDKLPPENVVVAGKLWETANRFEMSVERDFAANLGAVVGSKIGFDVQGVPVEFTVTSLRTVDWKTFGINFFFVARPGSLDDAPQNRLAAARLPAGSEDATRNRLARDFPNVTMIPIREVLERIAGILAKLGAGVRVLGGVAVFSGIVILFGAVAAGSVHRGREAAILQALGARRREVAARFAVEYALVGLVAGSIGTAGGTVLAWAVVHRGFEIPFDARPAPIVAALVAVPLLTIAAGLAASAGALLRRPIEALRDE